VELARQQAVAVKKYTNFKVGFFEENIFPRKSPFFRHSSAKSDQNQRNGNLGAGGGQDGHVHGLPRDAVPPVQPAGIFRGVGDQEEAGALSAGEQEPPRGAAASDTGAPRPARRQNDEGHGGGRGQEEVDDSVYHQSRH